MNDQPRTTDPFDIKNHMPEGAKMTDPYVGGLPTEQARQLPDGAEVHFSGRVDTFPEQPWYRKPAAAIAAGTAIVALCAGIAIGGLFTSTPKECEQALGYAEQAIGYSATGMGAAADGATGGLYARMQATDELNQVAADLKRITPLYKSAKAECLK